MAVQKTQFQEVPFQIHPRVFAALGGDLVTSDIVAILELVKNSYDAFAENVWIRFKGFKEDDPMIEIEDDGIGMSTETIDRIWCMVATPAKKDSPTTRLNGKVRRVAGEKGLGRLSVSRLGDALQMLTQERKSACIEVKIDWSNIAEQLTLSQCKVKRREYPLKSPFLKSGTILRISSLKSEWTEVEVSELQQNLARLISPFKESLGDFRIWLSDDSGLIDGDSDGEQEVEVEFPEFLARPKYAVKGSVDDEGNVGGTYTFRPIAGGKMLKRPMKLTWAQIYDWITDASRLGFLESRSRCGPFDFEIRAWDLDTTDTEEIAGKYQLQKSTIRKAIRVHQGLSVYRDGILVLPKSEKSRDWLGLDLRRVSKVGTRLSTSQIVGYVTITGDGNPELLDTSDRESLVSNNAAEDFDSILKAIVSWMETQRQIDRHKRLDDDAPVTVDEAPVQSLFAGLSANTLIDQVNDLAEEGAKATDAVPYVAAFGLQLEADRRQIEERFVHYSQMATVGTIAHMLVHEIRSHTAGFGAFLDRVHSLFGPFDDPQLAKYYQMANNSVTVLERLADTFSPLANRSFTRRKKSAVLEEVIRNSLEHVALEVKRKGVECSVPNTSTEVAVDPGELGAVVLNILNNSLYWLGQMPKENRQIQFKFRRIQSGTRVQVWVHDSGPGIAEEVLEKVFLPGVTRRPNGIGMGLTVASELIGAYGGKVFAKQEGALGGASIAFDIPTR